MIGFFSRLFENLVNSFRWRHFRWHLLAMALTLVLVLTDFDWIYYKTFRHTVIYQLSFGAAVVGGLLPILLPFVLLAVGLIRKNSRVKIIGLALGQAGIIAWAISSFYKIFTGRVYPPSDLILDISKVFHFGFWRAGIFWGWPSSHTTVAFATAVCLIYLFPKNKRVWYLSLTYAFLIGLGVSVSIHWFSDFVAGAMIGTTIGEVVGKSYFPEIKK
jgi:membrane-associated phospholipid phosphatase